MFAASGFDAKRDNRRIVLNRFGHAFINPQPDSFFGLDGKQRPVMPFATVPSAGIGFSDCV